MQQTHVVNRVKTINIDENGNALTNKIDTNNETSIPLGAGLSFIGVATDILQASAIQISVITDVASAEDGLIIEFSKDGINWDWGDAYTIVGTQFKEEISAKPSSQYFRIRYINGISDQSFLRISTIINYNYVQPSSHRLKDKVTEQDDAILTKSVQAFYDTNDGEFNNVSIQNPLPTDGDAVYAKDIWEDESNIGDFSGTVCDLFNDLHSVVSNTTSDNPKTLFIHFNRTIISNVIGLGAYTGNFSNVKITIFNSGGVETTVYDDSSNNTDLTTLTAQLPITAGFNAIKLYFHTTDTITLSNIVIPKTNSVVARLQATKPDNTVTDINATTGGNLKISLEEVESNISVNGNTQIKVTPFHSDGIEGMLISGVNYESGKSGIDAATEVLNIITYEHHEIHAGSHFNYCDYQLGNAVSDEIEFVLTTPNTTKWTHFTFSVYSSQGVTIELYEGTTGVSGGTSITPRNNNRNSSTVSGNTLVKDPTSITGDGIRAAGYLAGAGREAGFAVREKENVLKQNTAYLVRITSLANSNDISWCSEWYEHSNKN